MAEPIALGLGMAVGKAVFKAWFKDSEFLASASDSLFELISKAIPDWQARSAAQRQLGRMGEKAAAALEPLIEFEWGDLPHGEKATAVFQVQSAIESLNINARYLAEIEFSHEKLRSDLLKIFDGSMLVEGAFHLSERLIDEVSQLIIDLSGSLPAFNRETFAEILRRETAIIEAIDRLFLEFENIRLQSHSQPAPNAAIVFEEQYRRAAARRLDRIELFGLNATANPTSRQHNLSTAYISLSVSGDSLVIANDNENYSPQDKAKPPSNSTLSSVRAEEAANIARRVIIKGEAGSGKTTLLQSLAVRCATASFTDDMEYWNDLVPFFVPLRALTGDELPPPESLPSQIAQAISGTMPQGWVHQQLATGRALLLIDGLDEVSEVRRAKTRLWLEDILDSYPDCRVLITSRPPAIPDGWLAGKEFTEIELLPMSPTDVSSFIEHWHDAVANEEHNDTVASATRKLSTRLIERIRSDRALRELAGTPLLCAMLCAMNRDRKEVLPSNRIALYDAAVQLILHGRDEQRQVRVSDFPSIDFESKRDLLQDIAFWMMQNELSMAEEWQIVDLISKKLPRFPRLSGKHSADSVAKALLHRSGLLRSPVEGKCDFIHNAFKEYLSARAVDDGDQFGYLEGAVADSEAWREVAPMAAAITDNRRRTIFLSKLLSRGDQVPSESAIYHLLAVRCLETCTQLDTDIQAEITKRLKRLKAPDSIAQAKAMSAAGDLALNIVEKKGYRQARPAACCVRALRLIGSHGALEALEKYGDDKRVTVVKELMAAWPFFDRREYARRVLSRSPALWGGLHFGNLESLDGVGYLKNLYKLTVYARNQKLEDWHFNEISKLSRLTWFDLRADGVVDIENLRDLSSLYSLRLNVREIKNVDYLSEFSNLKLIDLNFVQLDSFTECDLSRVNRLTLTGNMELSQPNIRVGPALSIFFAPFADIELNVSFLRNATNLSRIALTYDNFKRSLDYLPNPENLEAIFVYSAQSLQSLFEIPESSTAKEITIRSGDSLRDLNGIYRFPQLQELNLHGIKSLRSIAELEQCARIKSITLQTQHNDLDLEPIALLRELRNITAPPPIVNKCRAMGIKANYRFISPIRESLNQ